MEAIFLKILNMSIAAGWLILAAVALRLLMKKAPRWLHCLLWLMVAVRLACPVSFESVWSLIPSGETVSPEIAYSPAPSINSGVPAINSAVNPLLQESFTPDPAASVNPLQIWTLIAAVVWITGMEAMFAYALVSFWRLRRKVRAAVPAGSGVWICDEVETPFILGIVSPRIYLPSYINEGNEAETAHVLAHERAHLKRRDHWWKPFGFILLSVYWFHPLVWLAYILFCRDIELACDERVVKDYSLEEKKAYSGALLSCSVSRKMVTACPLAFGETGVKERVKTVLNYKKPGFWAVVAAAFVCVIVAVCFLTNPKGHHDTLRFRADHRGGALDDKGGWFDVQLDRKVKSGVFYAEQWQDGKCTKSDSIFIGQDARELSLTCTVVKDKEDGAWLGVDIQLGPETDGSCLLTRFMLPERRPIGVPGRGLGFSFSSYEEGEYIQVAPGENRILATMAFELGNGVESYSCEGLEQDPERLKNAEYLVVIRGKFSDEEIPVQREEVARGDAEGEEPIRPYDTEATRDGSFVQGENLPETLETADGQPGGMGEPSGNSGILPEKNGGLSGNNERLSEKNGVLSGENSGARQSGNQAERLLTLEDILALSKKEDSLDWSDFDEYSYDETGSGLYIRIYETDSPFTLWIGGVGPGEEPMYIYLQAPETAAAGQEPDRIDIRDEDAETFIRAHGGLLLESAVRKVILEENRSEGSQEYVRAESHAVLVTEIQKAVEGRAADTVTVYAMALYQEYEIQEDGIREQTGSHMPVALTFVRDDMGRFLLAPDDIGRDGQDTRIHPLTQASGGTEGSGLARYSLKEYWTPGDGSYYVSDIRKKFPRTVVSDALDTQKYILSQTQDCYRQAVEYAGMDPYPVIEGLFEEILSAPKASSSPEDYEEAHLLQLWERELTYYGDYTLRYMFRQFSEGNQIGLKGQIMADIMEQMSGNEIMGEASYNGQQFFDTWIGRTRELDSENGREWMAENAPFGARCLKIMEEVERERIRSEE